MKNKSLFHRAVVSILVIGVSMNAIAGLFGFGGTSWKEEVLLHDGSKIMIERWHKRGGKHEIGHGPPIKEHGIEFSLPGTDKTIRWRDDYNEAEGAANFQLVALHIHDAVPYIVTWPYGSVVFNIWGRPNPPYVVFKYEKGAWRHIALSELPAVLKTVNVVLDPDGHERDLNKLGTVLADDVVRLNRYHLQPRYKTILREAFPDAEINMMFEKLVLYKGNWIVDSPIARKMIDQRPK